MWERQPKSKQTFSAGLPFALGSEIILELLCTDLILFDLLTAEALDLLEELGDLVGHCGCVVDAVD